MRIKYKKFSLICDVSYIRVVLYLNMIMCMQYGFVEYSDAKKRGNNGEQRSHEIVSIFMEIAIPPIVFV